MVVTVLLIKELAKFKKIQQKVKDLGGEELEEISTYLKVLIKNLLEIRWLFRLAAELPMLLLDQMAVSSVAKALKGLRIRLDVAVVSLETALEEVVVKALPLRIKTNNKCELNHQTNKRSIYHTQNSTLDTHRSTLVQVMQSIVT